MKTTQEKDKATARPWQSWATGFDDSTFAFGPNGKMPIGKMLGENGELNKANAAIIVKAVNEHAALNAVAESCPEIVSLLSLYDFEKGSAGDSKILRMKQALANLAALRKAQI